LDTSNLPHQPAESAAELPTYNYLYFLFKHKWFIIITTLLFTIGGVLFSLFVVEPQFKSEVNVVPPKMSDDGGMGSAISAAMRNFGVSSLLGGGGEEGYSMMVLLQARSAMDTLIRRYNLVDYYEIEDGSIEKARKILSGNLEVEYEKEGNYLVSVWDTDPQRAADMANDYIGIVNKLASDIYKAETIHNLAYLENRILSTDSTIALYSDSLSRFSAENKMFEPETQAESYAKAISDLKAEQAMAEIAMTLAEQRYGSDNPQTSEQRNMLAELNKKINQIENQPGFAGNFSLNNATSKAMRYYQLYANVEAFTKLKALMMPMLEKTRLDAIKSQRFFYVVDHAIAAEKKDRPKRSLIVAGAMIGGLATSVLILLLVAGWKVLKSKAYKFEL
jgi:capsule polysaccharide export protein KpsE/RkpR